jgi:hypothetical protein
MDWIDYARFAGALLFVLGLIAGRPKAERRLSVVENLPLDGKRRLVLLRCDSQEHLVLLGPSQDLALGLATPEFARRPQADLKPSPAPSPAHPGSSSAGTSISDST